MTKEYKKIATRETLDNYVAVPELNNVFEWHFIIFGLEGCDYAGGFYHGRISFPPQYPFKPPSVKMMTPSGRFQVNKKICTSFTDYHPELWNPMWGVNTIVLGLITFMQSDEVTAGGMSESSAKRRDHAQNSLSYNLK